MQFEADTLAKLASPVVTLLIFLIGKFTQAKSKLVVFYGHVSTFNLAANPPLTVFAHSIVIQNRGSKTANNVRVQHMMVTDNFRIDPPVKYVRNELPQNGFELVFETMVPKEQIVISYLYMPPMKAADIGGAVKSEEEIARQLNPFASPPPWLRNTFLCLALIGLAFVLYWPIRWLAQLVVPLLG